MRRKYNREQKEYIETKKALEALEAREKELEAAFVKSLGVVNEDGTVPSHTWAIDDERNYARQRKNSRRRKKNL
jgi:hypothetical protein